MSQSNQVYEFFIHSEPERVFLLETGKTMPFPPTRG